ncbi:SWAP (Suppressor-of-White-APricot)/surp domain-containing protein / D111/G-patch domain-containing protein isoform X3 [Carex rostrata]
MEKDLFANDGSFMEKFKQMQKVMEEKSNTVSTKPPVSSVPPMVPAKPSVVLNKRPLDQKGSIMKKTDQSTGTSSGATGKLAFSLKSKSKVVTAPVGFGMDEEDDEGDNGVSPHEPAKRHKMDQGLGSENGVVAETGVPSPPSDYTVRKVIDRLANLVAKNGRQHEHVTRQRNPGDTPFKFLFDKNCSEYKYYEYRLHEEEKALAQFDSHSASSHHVNNTSTAGWSGGSQRGRPQQKSYQTPAAALYGSSQEAGSSETGSASGPPSDPVAMMEFYMKKAAEEEKKRPHRLSKDEMPPPPSLQGSGKKGHHMGDFIPQEELEKFMARCNDSAAQKAAEEAAQKAKIQADNIGHKLLSKMGWKEGEGLGSGKSGRSDPVMAGDVKKDNLGVGAVKPGEVSAEDDIYEQYKKRMMLGYKHRPNPLGNPRKAYY